MRNQNGGALKATFCTFYDASTKQCTVCAESDGSIALRRGDSSGIVAQTAAGLFSHDPLIFDGYAVRVQFSATVGEFQVWKNGVSVYTRRRI